MDKKMINRIAAEWSPEEALHMHITPTFNLVEDLRQTYGVKISDEQIDYYFATLSPKRGDDWKHLPEEVFFILRTIHMAYIRVSWEVPRVGLKDKRAKLRKLRSLTKKLHNEAKSLDMETGALLQKKSDIFYGYPYKRTFLFWAIKMDKTVEIAQKTIEEAPKTMLKTNRWFKGLSNHMVLSYLAELYKKITERKPARRLGQGRQGDFHWLVERFFEHTPVRPRPKNIDSLLKTFLKQR